MTRTKTARSTRESFAGADRYETALQLANNYAGGGLRSVSTVIIASGETLIDAVTSAGLSGYKDAPILLTRSTGISRRVAKFIEYHGVGRVVVVGGTGSIPESVADDLEGLASEPTVTRIAGTDRAATAAAVAAELGGESTWCGTDESVAVLVNGSNMPAVDAISVGPIAYALELPMLLTDADALPDATTNFLMDENIERVVIVGGTGAVSADVADELSEIGVDAVQRIAGDSAAATSVELAELMLGDCSDDLGSSGTMVALVNRDATADGVSSAPVLGKGMGDGGPIPVLLVSDELPAAVRDYLASTPDEINGLKTNLTIIAIGGTAVVSEAVMKAAIEAATSASELTTTIKNVGADNAVTEDVDESRQFTLTFSDAIAPASATDSNFGSLKDVLYVNDAPASIAAEGIGQPGDTAVCEAGSEVTVTLTHELKAGDKIEVRPTATTFGDAGDKRPLQAAFFTVPAADKDTGAPSVTILAAAGHDSIVFVTSENSRLASDDADAFDFSKFEVKRGTAEVTVAATAGFAPDAAATKRLTVGLTFGADYDANNDGVDPRSRRRPCWATGFNLRKGDIVVLSPGAIVDKAGNGSRSLRTTVGTTTKSFTVSSVKIGPVDPGVDDDPDYRCSFGGRSSIPTPTATSTSASTRSSAGTPVRNWHRASPLLRHGAETPLVPQATLGA